MLSATVEQDGKKRVEHIFVIDCHSHLGQDVDGATMMNPLAPGQGTFDFWGNVQGKIANDWKKMDEQSFTTTMEGKQTKISWEFKPYPFTNQLYASLEKLGQKHSDLKEKSKFYAFIDQGVVFPFQDVFRDKRPEALYRASNINVSRFVTRFPFSMKLVGYARCDPMEGEKAVKEVTYAREVLGLRGLKLHPRSEGWIDNINSQKAIDVLIEAAKHSMPIIFDTRGKGSILAIGELIRSTRQIMEKSHPNLLPHFNCIIAHFAQGNVGDEDVYNTIVQPNTYGDLSMLHGEGAGNFFTDFRQWFKSKNKYNVDNRDWSEYLLYGSDYPYFGDVHAEKLIIYVINKLFFDTGGTIQDARNILGLNQLKILPEYNLPKSRTDAKILSSTMVSNPSYNQNQISSIEMATDALANLLVSNKIDIKKICLQFQGDFHQVTNDLLIEIVKKSTKEEIDFLIMDLIENQASLLAPLHPNMEWNPFGYKYFNPEDRAFFAKLFKNCYLSTNVDTAVQGLTQIFS